MFNLIFAVSLAISTFNQPFIIKPPTNTTYSLLRGGPGTFGASRGSGKSHSGVDIVANQSSNDKSIYSVFAVNNGVIAYAQMNGTATTGYGYTIVIDHGDGNYSQYSHLATNASQGIVNVGDNVVAGQLIGYMADLSVGEKSSGNVRADVVMQYDKIQLHFECYFGTPGIRSPATLSTFRNNGGFLIDPTAQLKALNYNSF